MQMKLQLRQTQQLVMTPQLVQAIRLLQLSGAELVEEIRNELDGNPVLADDVPEPRRGTQEAAGAAPEPPRLESLPDRPALDLESRKAERKVEDIDWEKLLENNQQQRPIGSERGGFEDLPSIEQNLTGPKTLRAHLLWQIQMSDLVDDEKRFAALVVGNLDERGYLDLHRGGGQPDITLDELAEEAGLNPEDAPEVLALIQRFDPVGVAARDLRECLLIQAEVLGFDAVEKAVIRDHLHHVERHNFQAIAKALKVDVDEVQECIREIRKLESTPARNFVDVDERQLAITPDVYVTREGDRFVVTDNDRGLQRLRINESLAQRMLQDPRAKEFIQQKLKSAEWLMGAVEQRRRTILRVTECIVERQRDFLERGPAHLKPMILRDVAEAIGMHESTISRATSNKYVHTPQGVLELKYFFNSSIGTTGSEDIASESVKQAIKGLVSREDKKAPLSDEAIVRLLKEKDGICIARRTVAKYRDELGILSSQRRKQMF